MSYRIPVYGTVIECAEPQDALEIVRVVCERSNMGTESAAPIPPAPPTPKTSPSSDDGAPLQRSFLRAQKLKATAVTVIAMDGHEYNGIIVDFDRFSVLLRSEDDALGGEVKHLFFKHAIRAIRKVKPRGGDDRRREAGIRRWRPRDTAGA